MGFVTFTLLSSMYYQKITTHRDFKLSELEVETCTKITVPINGTNGKLTIIGEDTTSIIQARHHLHSIIEYIRYVHPPMQFLSIPLLSDEVKKNFEIFKVRYTIYRFYFKIHLNLLKE